MKRRVLIPLGMALSLAACSGGGGGPYAGYAYYNDPFYDPWDYGFRYGVYATEEDIDVDFDGSDLERPGDFERPDRPTPPSGARPSWPAGGFDRPARPAGGGGFGGGGRSFRGGGGRR